jgi:hypothetical protein
MTIATHILQTPALFQWDADSKPCQNTNCRPTSEAMIASYYLDRHISPTEMRGKMTGNALACGGTYPTQGIKGLQAYGIQSSQGWKTPAGVIGLVRANIPVDLVVDYGKLPRDPRYICDMGFKGLHSVVACKYGTNTKGEKGLYIRDPDRWGKYRQSYVFWPDSIWVPAFVSNRVFGGIVTHPKAPKKFIATPPIVVPKPAEVVFVKMLEAADTVHLRTRPDTKSSSIMLIAKGKRMQPSLYKRDGQPYVVNGKSLTDWYEVTFDGKRGWVAAAYVHTIN